MSSEEIVKLIIEHNNNNPINQKISFTEKENKDGSFIIEIENISRTKGHIFKHENKRMCYDSVFYQIVRDLIQDKIELI